MSIDRIAVKRLATATRQGKRPDFMPGTESPTSHLGTVVAVDAGRNEANIRLNEYGDPIAYRVPIRQSGGRFDLPAVNDIVQLEYADNALQVIGRQYRPVGSVTFG